MERQASEILLGRSGRGDRFSIRWHGIKLRLEIKAITALQMIKISRELTGIENIDQVGTPFSEHLRTSNNLIPICRAIAIATGTRFVNIVSRAILGLPNEDICKLWKMVIKWGDPDSFFFIMVSSGKMNKVKKAEV